MKRFSFLLLSSLLLLSSACKNKDAQSDTNLSLPVSEERVCKDWVESFKFLIEQEQEVKSPHEYCLQDINGDGIAEVLVRAEDGLTAGMFSYNKKEELSFYDVTDDGYIELGAGPGWYVRRYDNHMNEYRVWTSYYYKANNGEFTFIGDRENGFNGVDENGDYIDYESDNTGGKGPTASDTITMFYEISDWLKFSDQAVSSAQSYIKELSEETQAETEEESNPVKLYKEAYELTLQGDVKCRVDLKYESLTKDSRDVVGWTTYYRKNGNSSKIRFFGSKIWDINLSYSIFVLHEYNNGKCCGHLKLIFNENGDFLNGYWRLGEKELFVERINKTDYDETAEPEKLTSPSKDNELLSQLLPCTRFDIDNLVNQIYPGENRNWEVMLFDMNNDKVFEGWIRTLNQNREEEHAFLWMQDGGARLLYDNKYKTRMKVIRPYIILLRQDDSCNDSQVIYEWEEVEPNQKEFDTTEHESIVNSSYWINDFGDWSNMN